MAQQLTSDPGIDLAFLAGGGAMGERIRTYPWANPLLGEPRRAWEEVWPIVGAQIEQVLCGEGAVRQENQRVPIIRHGALQEVYWTYSYSPIVEPDSPHGVGGVLVTCTETTQQVLAQRKLAAERERFVQLFDQAPTFLAVLKGPDHGIELANPGYLRALGQPSVNQCSLAPSLFLLAIGS